MLDSPESMLCLRHNACIIPAGDRQSKQVDRNQHYEAKNLLDHLDHAILTVRVTRPQYHTLPDSTGRARS